MIAFLFSKINLYVCRYFIFWLLLCLIIILCITSLFEGIELLRRTISRTGTPLSIITEMIFLKLPTHLNTLLPFTIFFSAILSLSRLIQSRELTVIRATGVSLWQILTGLSITVSLLYGIYITVFNPIGAALTNRYLYLERSHFKTANTSLIIGKSGLWLCENNDQYQTIIHTQIFNLQENWFQKVTFYNFDKEGHFHCRYDAETATLENGEWKLSNVYKWPQQDNTSSVIPCMSFQANFSLNNIEDSYAAPETLSFWKIPDFTKSLRKTGLSSRKYELYWHKQIGKLGLIIALTFLAVLFCFQSLPYRQNVVRLFGQAIVSGFIIYFLNDIIIALGAAQKIPILLSVWLVPLVTMMLSLAFLLHIEHPS